MAKDKEATIKNTLESPVDLTGSPSSLKGEVIGNEMAEAELFEVEFLTNFKVGTTYYDKGNRAMLSKEDADMLVRNNFGRICVSV